MPIQVDRSVVGKEYPPFPVTVERGKIKEFARAIGDLNPFYLDDRVGAASAWGDVIAPPTFAVTFRDERADAGEGRRRYHVAPRGRSESTRLNSSHGYISYAVFC